MLSGSKLVITGCSRGIGLALVKELIARPSNKAPALIVATCRRPDEAEELSSLAKSHKSLHLAKLDMTDTEAFTQFGEEVKRICEGQGLNILINNAGIATFRPPSATKITAVTKEEMMSTYLTNTVGPLLLTKTLMAELGQGASNSGNQSLVVNMSAFLASIGENKQGGFYPLRSSKAGLNAVTKSMAADLAKLKIGALAVHPGWVQTDMGSKHAALTPKQSVDGMLEVMDNFTLLQSGSFLDYTGKGIPW